MESPARTQCERCRLHYLTNHDRPQNIKQKAKYGHKPHGKKEENFSSLISITVAATANITAEAPTNGILLE
jgi:hypothetical protein